MKKTTKKNTKKKKYEYKKHVVAITCVLTLVLGILIGTFVYRYTKGETLLQNGSKVFDIKNYLSVTNTARKFSSKEYTIIFGPYGYNLKNNKDYYLLIDTTNPDKVNYSYGTYVQESNHIELDNGDKLYISDDGLRYNDSTLSIDKDNFDYYTYKDEESRYLLIRNTKKNLNYVLYVNTRKNSITVMNDSYTESDDYITLSDGTLFTKGLDNSHITYNSIQMNIGK